MRATTAHATPPPTRALASGVDRNKRTPKTTTPTRNTERSPHLAMIDRFAPAPRPGIPAPAPNPWPTVIVAAALVVMLLTAITTA